MAKRKAKMNSSGKESVVPPQPRSLRSRKRGCSSDEISEPDNVQATLRHQDTEGNNTTVEAALLQCNQSPLQEFKIPTQQHEAAEQSCITAQDPDTEEKHAKATNAYLKNVTVKASEEQKETTVTNPNSDSQPESFREHADRDADNDKEELTIEECNRSPSQTCTDQLQVFSPGDEKALEEQLSSKENTQCNLEKKQLTSQEESSNKYKADIEEITKEAAAGLPAKKKRRMGMCGLTERERSHFLQTQKRENGHNGPERAVRQICNNTDEHVAQEEVTTSPSTPVGSVTDQDEAAIEHQSSHNGEDDRTETEVCIAVTTSDGSSTVCDPGCAERKSSEGEGGVVPGSEQPGEPKSDPPAEEEEEELFGNQQQQQQQELDGHRDEIVAEKPQKQMKNTEDGSAVVDRSPVITFHSNPSQNKETENGEAIKASLLLVTGTRDEKEGDLTGDAVSGDRAEAGASSTDSRSGGFNAVQLCEAVETPSGSERKDSCEADGEPGVGPAVNAEPPQSRDTTNPFGSGYLDYVSDSQLNTIFLTEEEVMEREEDVGSTDCHEDATDLICGLVRELSSLNRKVMATHRELENLRRSSKSSRSAMR